MQEIRVGGVYAIQARSFTFGEVTLCQDTVIEIKDITNGMATFWSSQDNKDYECDVSGLKWVI